MYAVLTREILNTNEVIHIFQQQGPYLRSEQLVKNNVHTSLVRKMVIEGSLEKIKRGFYRLTAEMFTDDENFTIDYFDAAAAVPKGIFCLSTSLHYYQLTTQRISMFDIAIPRTQRTPVLYNLNARFYRFQDPYYSYGVEEIKTKTGIIKFYNAEKTICDAYRQRRIIGEDIALESLNNYLKQYPKDINKLLKAAGFCRVKHLIEPVVKTMIGY